MIGKAKESLASVREKLSDLKSNLWDTEKNEIINEFKEKGESKVNEILEMMSNYTSLFKEAGYEPVGIHASLGLPPEISVEFKCLPAISLEKRKNILKKSSDCKMASILLQSLFKASDFSATVRVGKFKLKTIKITLGLIPGIGISLSL